MIDMQKVRSLPNCKIDYAAANEMYKVTAQMRPDDDGNPDYGQIIGAYLGWALDEIDRLNERVSDLEESLTIAYMLGGNAKEKEIDRLREALVDERANQIGWLAINRGEMTWEEATRDDARRQLEAEGKL